METEEEFQGEAREKGNESLKEIEPIYDGDLEQENIVSQPILKPVANINNSFIDTQRLLNKSLFDYKKVKQTIDGMLNAMPKYSQTIIVSELQKLVMHIEQLIFLADHQQETLKRTISEMIQISEDEMIQMSNEKEFVERAQVKNTQIEEKNKTELPDKNDKEESQKVQDLEH